MFLRVVLIIGNVNEDLIMLFYSLTPKPSSFAQVLVGPCLYLMDLVARIQLQVC